VKGVEPEAREAARMAARRQSLPLGEWLSQTILAAATRELKHGDRRIAAAVAALDDTAEDPNAPDLVMRAQQVYGQRLRPVVEPAAERKGPPALTTEAIMESIRKLAARVDEAENRTAEAIAPLAERLSTLDGRIAEIRERDPASTAPVERAMMRLAERVERLEGEHSPNTKRGIAGRLSGGG
jgi:localization factor PodJL